MALTGHFFFRRVPNRFARSQPHHRNRHPSVKRHDYCVGSETETTMLRDCPPDAKATLALIALSAICILGWLADLGL